MPLSVSVVVPVLDQQLQRDSCGVGLSAAPPEALWLWRDHCGLNPTHSSRWVEVLCQIQPSVVMLDLSRSSPVLLQASFMSCCDCNWDGLGACWTQHILPVDLVLEGLESIRSHHAEQAVTGPQGK